ncbi:MAG: HAMP domain-containing protein [Gammaproteobacteria bacterium]|nr:HAMP domain-containing protein [Gammaproteobacteria bacterium]
MKNMLNNISIKTKIIGTSLILLSMIVGSSGFALYAMNRIGHELDAITERDIPMTTVLTEITEHQLMQTTHFERALRYGILLEQEAQAPAHFKKEIAAFESLSAKVSKEIKEGEALRGKAIEAVADETSKNELMHVDEVLQKIEKEHTDFEHHAQEVFVLLTQGKTHEAELFAEKMETEGEQLAHELAALLSSIEMFTEEAAHQAAEYEHTAITILGFLVTTAIVIGVLVSWIVSSNVVGRLGETAKGLETIASGDLTQNVTVDGRDEIGKVQQSMHKMLENLQSMISQINDTTAQLSTAAEEVSVVTVQTSNNIKQQQSETDQIATAMNEMTTTVQDVAMNVSSTSTAANGANAETESGRKVVEATVDGIQHLASQIENAADVIAQVEKNSENINTVLDVIKGIAEQTNLLALNAAIEAARAGEQGRGFAVVADEVRTLAARTQESTAEINQIIESLQSGSRNAVQAMNQSREQAKSVVEQASLAGTSLTTISGSVSQIDEMSSQIATAAEEQNSVAEEMNRNIVRISDMAVQNATGAEQTSQAGKNLACMASELQGLVATFRVQDSANHSIQNKEAAA